jgi:glycosyltransferase involved in cell wall biosynthesis
LTSRLLLSIFPTFAVGGAQSRFTTLANHFGSTWRHAIVAMDGVTDARERFASDVQVTFPDVNIKKGDLLGNSKRFRDLIRALAPTTMLTHNFGSIEWAIANRLSLVRHVHVEDGFGPDERESQLPRRVWLRRIFLRRRPIVLPSKTLMRIAGQIWRMDERQLHYVPNGIDLNRFASPFSAVGNPTEGPLIGTVAALRPEKNVGRLIRAFHSAVAQAPARLIIVGEGPQRNELEALVATLGLSGRVQFAGHVSQPDSLLRTFDIFAMSSDTEQMPISLLEAMAAGLPTAATDVGDIASMLPAVGRSFVTPCDDTALASALTILIGNSALRVSLGRASKAKAVQSFDQTDMLRRWSSLLETGTPLSEADAV